MLTCVEYLHKLLIVFFILHMYLFMIMFKTTGLWGPFAGILHIDIATPV